MPTYQYKREDGTIFEVFQGINDPALATCPETGQNVQRVITGGGGVVYKGTGWYVTDYKSSAGSKGSGSGDRAGTGSGAGAGEDSHTSAEASASANAGSGSDGSKSTSVATSNDA